MYYVIQVKTGKEQKAIEDIMKNKPDDESFEVFAPYRKAIKKFHGVEKEVVERCFPGYIFVNTDDAQALFKQLYFTPGFTKLLGREADTENFVPLDQDESRMIDILYSPNTNRITEISNIEVKEGEMIRVLDGPRLVSSSLGINIVTNIINI